jgi:DUF1680 family protein
VAAGSYVEIRRDWANGDVVELELPMAPFPVEAHPLVEEARNQIAVVRGPLVYCLESVDLPDGIDIDDVRIPGQATWRAIHNPDLLGGVTVLRTEATVRSGGPWAALYRRVPKQKPRTLSLQLVPYYTWNNRGVGEMSVWLPVE